MGSGSLALAASFSRASIFCASAFSLAAMRFGLKAKVPMRVITAREAAETAKTRFFTGRLKRR